MKKRLRAVPMLAFAYGIAAASSFLLNICVGRSLGAQALGDFALAVAVARIFYAATDLGITAHLTRTLARDTTQTNRLLALSLGYRVFLVPLGMLVTSVSGVMFERHDVSTFIFVAIAQGAVTVQSIYESLLLSHERQPTVAALTIISATSVATGVVIWVLLAANLTLFSALYAVTSIVGVSCWATWSARQLSAPLRIAAPDRSLLRELTTSWPIGISTLFAIAALRAPLLVLGAFVPPQDVGAFSAVDMVVTAIGILQTAVSSATFPKLAASYRHDPPRFRRLLVMSNLALISIGLVAGGFLAIAGSDLLALVFPSRDFARISTVMPIVAWSTPGLLFVHHNIYIFAACNREAANLRFMALWFVLIAGFQLACVPDGGLVGGAWALLAARTLGCVLLAVTILVSGMHRGSPTKTR